MPTYKKCFTIIEMLVVLAIIGVLSVSILINKQHNQSRTDLLNAAKTMALDIRRAQNYAMNSAAESGEVPCGYGIYFDKNNSLYKFFYENTINSSCDTDAKFGSSANGQESEAEKESRIIDNNIIIGDILADSTSMSAASIFFTPPDPVFYVEGSMGKSLEIILKVSGTACPSDYCKSIIVNSLGQVSIE